MIEPSARMPGRIAAPGGATSVVPSVRVISVPEGLTLLTCPSMVFSAPRVGDVPPGDVPPEDGGLCPVAGGVTGLCANPTVAEKLAATAIAIATDDFLNTPMVFKPP